MSCGREKKNNTVPDEATSKDLAKLSELINKEPENAGLYYKRALIYLDKNNNDNALNDVYKAIGIDNKNSDYFCLLADILFATGKLKKSTEAIEQAIALKPSNTNALLKKAELFFFYKKYDSTFYYIDKTMKLDKNNNKALFMRAMAFKEAGDTNKAINDFNTVIENENNHIEAYMQLGLLYSIKKNKLALDYFNNVLNIDPTNIEALYAKAMFFQESAEYNKAIETYTSIINIKPDYKFAYFNLGYIHLVYLKVYNVAIDYFSKAIAVAPDYYEAFYNRGYSYELRGDIFNAKKDYKTALELKTNYQKAIDGLNRIER